jgi:hypothetical protein
MAKTFEPIVVEDFEGVNKNFKDIQEKTKLGIFTPTFTDIGGTPTGIGYFTLYGPMCHYLIEISPANGQQLTVDWDTIGSEPKVLGIPYGPLSVPGTGGSKINPVSIAAPEYNQVLACWASGSIHAGGNLVAEHPWAAVSYTTVSGGPSPGGAPCIYFPGFNTGGITTLTADWKIYMSGSFLRR